MIDERRGWGDRVIVIILEAKLEPTILDHVEIT